MLMYYLGFSYSEAMSLPVWQRKWFIDRIVTEMKNANASRAAHDNDATSRAMRGTARDTVPAKLRRFT